MLIMPFLFECILYFFDLHFFFVLDRSEQYPALPKFKSLLLSFGNQNLYNQFNLTKPSLLNDNWLI